MNDETTCGEALVALLEAYGVDTVFGIPGVHTLALYRGLERSGIRHVRVRHEQGAGFMADGYARTSGRAGTCFLISGPGVTNAVTAMGQAYADSIPMLVISSDTTSRSQGKGWGCLHEVTDLVAVTRPVTAFSARVHEPEELEPLLARAFSLFASGRPRPVHISVPIDVLERPVRTVMKPRTPPSRACPDAAGLDRAAELLGAAAAPVVLAGGGATDACGPISELAERFDAPVVTSIRAKGVIPDSHPLALGGGIAHPVVHRLVGEADVVLAIGTELSETDSFVERLAFGGKLIRVDLDPDKINDHYGADVGIVADARAATVGLLEHQPAIRERRLNGADRVSQSRRAITESLSDLERRHAVFLDALRAALKPEAMVFGDMCQVVYSGAFLFPVELPRRWPYP
ncbi:MAG: 5-guanidino-2-oxopentanoate decarboxylase, partial [Proteobacteria bacterium]